MRWIHHNGGRPGKRGDCACRSVAIATGLPYEQVAALIRLYASRERRGTRKRGISDPNRGVYRQTMFRVMAALDWTWTPTMRIGSGCHVHLKDHELPPGRLVVSLSKHFTCVIDGVIYDTHDPSRGGTRCVYGYWKRG